MDAWVITLIGNEYSEQAANRCIKSANIPVHTFPAATPDMVDGMFRRFGIEWTWGPGHNGMAHKPYGGDDGARKACFLSHYMLWKLSEWGNMPMMILEHDAVFVRDYEPFEFEKICMINDPLGATPRGDWWSERMEKRGPGVWPKTKVFGWNRPDGLAGNSAYVITPEGARELIALVEEVGAWPNDAIMCRQLMSGLQEHYPFITEVQACQSTIQQNH